MNYEERTVLACWKCNNERNKDEMKEAGLEKIQELSGSKPATKEELIKVIQTQAAVIKKLRKALVGHGLRNISNGIKDH